MPKPCAPHTDCDPSTCFAAKLRTVRFGFANGHGRADWHGPTIAERAERQVTAARSAGLDPQNVGNRWV